MGAGSAGRKRQKTAFSPCRARCGASPRENSVETYWSPLTPEHGFPSLSVWPGHRALPLCPFPALAGLPVSLRQAPLSQKSIRIGGFPHGVSTVQVLCDSLRWHYPHQVKGRSAALPLSLFGSPVLSPIMTPTADPVKEKLPEIDKGLTSGGGRHILCRAREFSEEG